MNNINISDDEVFYTDTISGKKECDEELALSILLRDGIVFHNTRKYSLDGAKIDGRTVVLFVMANDLFAWACADAEDLPGDEIGNLYKMYKEDPRWGSAKWCCFRRKEKPQKPVVAMMKQDGSWDDKMESLPDNKYDRMYREEIAKIKKDIEETKNIDLTSSSV